MQRKDGRYRTASAQAVIREQIVEYLKKKKGTQQQAADIFGLNIRSVNRIWARYKKGGEEALKRKSVEFEMERRLQENKQQK